MGVAVTYQAIHKSLIQMLNEQIVIKVDKEYLINPKWVKNTKDFYSKLETTIENFQTPSNETIITNDVTKLEFENLHEYYTRILDFFEYVAKIPYPGTPDIDGPMVAQLYHMYWVLVATKKQDEQMRFITKHSPDSYFVCNCDTPTDRMLGKYFENQGIKVRTGVECAQMCDVFTGGGFVIQTFFTAELKKELDKLYENFSNASESDLLKIYDSIYRKKTSIVVIISKKSALENQIYEQTKKLFSDG